MVFGLFSRYFLGSCLEKLWEKFYFFRLYLEGVACFSATLAFMKLNYQNRQLSYFLYLNGGFFFVSYLQFFIHQLSFIIFHNLEEWIIDNSTNQDQHQTEDDISPIHT